MRDRLLARLVAALAVVGNIVGLRSTESDVTITVEGRWSGKFDPVRLGLTIIVVVLLVVAALWAAIRLGDSKEVMPPTATNTPHPQFGWLEGVEGGISPITTDALAVKRLHRGGHPPAT